MNSLSSKLYEETLPNLTFNNYKLPFQDLKNPQAQGLNNVYNFYFTPENGVKIGVWHFIPPSLEYTPDEDSHREVRDHLKMYLKEDHPVFIYVHGITAHRGYHYRAKLCKNLNEMGYHVFSVDCRSYGDSTGKPTEIGMVTDVVKLYELIKSYNKQAKVILYGHSIGTGIVCHAAKILSDKNVKLDGVVLEAPLRNAKSAAKYFPFTTLLFRSSKWMDKRVDYLLEKTNIHLKNDQHIREINSKILAIYCKYDFYIPYKQVHKLKEAAEMRSPKLPPTRFVFVEKRLGYGSHFFQSHKPLYHHIKEFVIDD